jgi:PhoH-like ATPase
VYAFAEHEVVVPLIVISELEAKRHHHELGWFARQALRMFDDLRLEHGRLDQPIPVGTQGGTLHVELNHCDSTVLPAGFRTDSNDSRVLICAANLAAEGKRVTLVSKDIPLRVKAARPALNQHHLQRVVEQAVERLPIVAAGLDHHTGDLRCDQMLTQREDLRGRRTPGGRRHRLGASSLTLDALDSRAPRGVPHPSPTTPSDVSYSPFLVRVPGRAGETGI